MSTQRKAEFSDRTISEQAVQDYLADNPDFFERHGDLLKSLRLPHGSGGTVSLVERQVSVLRQKELKNDRKLKELLAVARANDALATKIHLLTVKLLRADSLKETLACIEGTLRSNFDADHSILILFGDPYARYLDGKAYVDRLHLARGAQNSGQPVCGRVKNQD